MVGGRRDEGVVQADGTWYRANTVHVAEVERGPLGAGGCGRKPGVAGDRTADGISHRG